MTPAAELAQLPTQAEHLLGPWRPLSAEWMRVRAAIGAREIEGPEPAACELVVLGGPQRSDAPAQTEWWAADRLAAERTRRLLGSMSGSTFEVHRRTAGHSHRHVSYHVGSAAPLPEHVRLATDKERRRLDAGDGWLRGAFEPEQLARALWSATVLATPPMYSLRTRSPVWRLPSRTDAEALHTAGQLLGLPLGALERRGRLWRVSVDQEPDVALRSLQRALLP